MCRVSLASGRNGTPEGMDVMGPLVAFLRAFIRHLRYVPVRTVSVVKVIFRALSGAGVPHPDPEVGREEARILEASLEEPRLTERERAQTRLILQLRQGQTDVICVLRRKSIENYVFYGMGMVVLVIVVMLIGQVREFARDIQDSRYQTLITSCMDTNERHREADQVIKLFAGVRAAGTNDQQSRAADKFVDAIVPFRENCTRYARERIYGTGRTDNP